MADSKLSEMQIELLHAMEKLGRVCTASSQKRLERFDALVHLDRVVSSVSKVLFLVSSLDVVFLSLHTRFVLFLFQEVIQGLTPHLDSFLIDTVMKFSGSSVLRELLSSCLCKALRWTPEVVPDLYISLQKKLSSFKEADMKVYAHSAHFSPFVSFVCSPSFLLALACISLAFLRRIPLFLVIWPTYFQTHLLF